MSGTEFSDGDKNWEDGLRVTLNPGDRRLFTDVWRGVLYAVFAYNAAGNANDVDITVTPAWGGSKTLTIPGTARNAGSAALAFFSGDDTPGVRVSLSGDAEGPVEVWVGRIIMPLNTSGMTSREMPTDGHEHTFDKYTWYYGTIGWPWLLLTLTSDVKQFLCVQFAKTAADVFVLNDTADGLLDNQVIKIDRTANQDGVVKIHAVDKNTHKRIFKSDGSQWAWMHANGHRDSDHSTIMLEGL